MASLLRVLPRQSGGVRGSLAAQRRANSQNPPPGSEGDPRLVGAYAQVKSKAHNHLQSMLEEEKHGLNKKWTDPTDWTLPRDPEAARGTVLEGVVREGRLREALPDDEYVKMIQGVHPATPDHPKASGDWALDPNKSLRSFEVATEADGGVSGAERVMSLKHAQDEARVEKRKVMQEVATDRIVTQLNQGPGAAVLTPELKARAAVSPTITPPRVTLAGGQSIPTPTARPPLETGFAVDSLPPTSDYPIPVRLMTKEEEEYTRDAEEQRLSQMEKVYDDAYERWKATKKLEKSARDRFVPQQHLDEQGEPIPLTEDEIDAANKKHAVAMEERRKAVDETEDPLEALERELYPERFDQQQEVDDDAAALELQRKARANNKMIPNALTLEMKKQIQTMGPITIANFMKEANINPRYGYYTTKKKVFGREGDFITSPEISVMFGECVAAWVADTWHKLGQPRRVHLVELGGGRGALMAAVLRSLKAFPALEEAARIGMVEISETLMEAQRSKITEVIGEERAKEVEWADDLEGLSVHDESIPIIAFCNELFDCFAVSKFQYTERGWCEWLVEIDDDPEVPEHFKFVLSNGETSSSIAYLPHSVRNKARDERKLGMTVELQMQGYLYLDRLLTQLANSKGSLLVVDYGVEGLVEDSLRGIRNHEFVHPLSNPGEVDLSGFVSFEMLKNVVERSDKLHRRIHATDSMSQADFLTRVGIEARAAWHLVNEESTRNAARIIREYETLTNVEDASGMGKRFRAMCFSSKEPHGLVPPCPW